MAEWRETNTLCPLDEQPLNITKCSPCRFFRGASLSGPRRYWRVNCNFPRNGSEVYTPIPAAFERAFPEMIDPGHHIEQNEAVDSSGRASPDQHPEA